MTFRQTLKKQLRDRGAVKGRKWFTKLNTEGLIKEIKMVFNAEEYAAANPNRKLYGDQALATILEKDKIMKDEISR
mgnify:CR=1 FL=1|tara:strand:- start:269 stop:496 length:228 start_codon:yes stop_codon:yes gene_type:complete